MSEKAAYFAGLFDGEGNVFIETKGRSLRLSVTIKMTCERTVRAFHEFAGGAVKNVPPANERCQPQYRCRVQGIRAADALHAMLPYLITRRQPVVECLAAFEARPAARFGVRYRKGA